MRQLIQDKIMDIEQEMEKMKFTPLYYLTSKWTTYVEIIKVLNELLQSKKR